LAIPIIANIPKPLNASPEGIKLSTSETLAADAFEVLQIKQEFQSVLDGLNSRKYPETPVYSL